MRLDTAKRRQGSVFQFAMASYGVQFLALITAPLLARSLGPSGRGELAAVMTYSLLLALFLSAGVPIAVKEACARTPEKGAAITATALRMTWILPIPAALTAILVAWGPLSHLSGAGRMIALLLLSVVPLGIASDCLSSRLVAEGALGALAAIKLVPRLITALAIISLFALNSLTFVVAALLVQATICIELLIAWRANTAIRTRERVPVVPLLRFGRRALFAEFSQLSNLRIDQAVLPLLISTAALGRYSVAVTVAMLPFPVSQAIIGKFFRRMSAPVENERIASIELALRATILLTLAGALGLAATAPVMIPIVYGHPFSPAVAFTLLLLPGTVAFAGSYVASQALLALGRPTASGLGHLVAAGATIVGILPAVAWGSVMGAALLSTVTSSLSFMIFLRLLRPHGVHEVLPRAADARWLLDEARMRLKKFARWDERVV